MCEQISTRRVLCSVEQARIAGERDFIEGYPCSPAFRSGTLENKAYKEGYYNDKNKLHTSRGTH